MENRCTGEKLDVRGRSADFYPYEKDKIVKLFLKEISREEIDIECENTIEAFRTGCTAMQCYGEIEFDGRIGIILDRVNGIPMTKLPEKNPLSLFTCSKMLAEQHLIVHSKHSNKLRDVRKVAVDFLSNKAMDILTDEEKAKAKTYIESLPEGDTVLHLDFHTENILVDNGKCVAIDWLTAARGHHEVEVAQMQFLFHDSLLFPGCSKFQLMLYSTLRSFIYNGYIKRYKKATGVDLNEVKKWKIVPLIIRRCVWAHEFETEPLTRQIKECLAAI